MTLRHPALLGAFLIGAILPPALVAQKPIPADLNARVDQIFARYTPQTPGCGVGLSKDGKPLYIRAYGSANLEYGIPNSDSTVFESGSIAKQFTASAIVLLAQDGKLSLDDDIRKYLPEVPSFGGQKITIRNLLTHTSGLRDQWGLLAIEGRGPGAQVHTPMTTLDLVAHQKMLNFPPGSEYLYSNTGYALAGIIVERVSGKSLNDFLQERFFKPLGMNHTQLRDDFTRIVPNRATAYSGSATNGFRQDMPFTNMVGNGGVLSTMADLLKWNENLDHPTVGGAEYVKTLETPMVLTNGKPITYALGVIVAPYAGLREVGHSGSTAGYSTYMSRFPDQHVAVAVWCNVAGAPATALAHQVAELILPTAAVANAGTSVTNAGGMNLAEKWAGTYRDAHTDQALTFTASNNTLNPTGLRAAGFTAITATTFRSLGNGGDIIFSGTPGHRSMILARAGDTTRFDEVRPPASPIPMADYTGTYASDELEMRYEVVARNGKLFLTRRPYQAFELQPQYVDDFLTNGGLGTVRFARDAKGKVTGFSFYAGRVLDVRYKRVTP